MFSYLIDYSQHKRRVPKLCGIYCIENKINHLKYIGQSKDILRRWSGHKTDLNCNRHNNNHLQHAWNYYGAENFDFSILEICSPSQIDDREKWNIKHYKSNIRGFGYNIEEGGKKIVMSDETKEKLRQSHIGLKQTPEHIQKRVSQLSRKVICLTTGEIFNSTKEADRYYNIGAVHKVCNHSSRYNYNGKLPDGTPLRWQYYDEYLLQQNKGE